VLTKEQKMQLFRRILLDFGIGAKTNVGYGQFEEGFKERLKHQQTTGSSQMRSEPQNYTGSITERAILEGKVIDENNKIVKTIVNGKELHVRMAVGVCPPKGSLVQVTIAQLNKKKEVLLVRFERELK